MKNRVSHFGIGLLLVGLLVSSGLNLFLYTQAHDYYLQLNQTRLDPLQLDYFNSNSDPKELPHPDQKVVVFFGDSRAASWSSPTHLSEFKFINRGIGAQTSAQTLYRFDDHLKPLQPQVIILQVGINDLKTIPLFPEHKDTIIANCQANIQQIVEQSTKNGATIILTTIFPTGQVPWDRKFFWSPDIAQAINEVNNFIRSLETKKVRVFDAYSILADNGTGKEEYFQDTLHLNSTGYEALNNELAQILADLP